MVQEALPFVYFFGATTAAACLGLLLVRNVFHMATLLLVILLSVAALFVLALADFLAIVQIVVYVGGVLILILFGIMFTTVRGEKNTLSVQMYRQVPVGMLAVVVFTGMVWMGQQAAKAFAKRLAGSGTESAGNLSASSAAETGVLLMTEHLLAFELAGILLLAALIGATLIAAKER